jgi:hypothetical protein
MAGALASPEDQPCRKKLLELLEAEHGDLQGLNRAWGTDFRDWSGVRAPAAGNSVFRADEASFERAFARQYFSLVAEELNNVAPNHLYLGCRFAGAPGFAVKACAEFADVLSFNIYRRLVDCEEWMSRYDIDKPAIIGEFHFGALDRGMFHQGLVPVESQEERGDAYKGYVRSVLECPMFVGCHWFQYVDEPVTGRTWDGENYNIGFLDVTDTPYPEMVDAAREVHGEAYELRMKLE